MIYLIDFENVHSDGLRVSNSLAIRISVISFTVNTQAC